MAFAEAWEDMRNEVGERSNGSIFGDWSSRRRAPCGQGASFLDVDMRRLPGADAQRLPWLNVDASNSVWVGALPSAILWSDGVEFFGTACP